MCAEHVPSGSVPSPPHSRDEEPQVERQEEIDFHQLCLSKTCRVCGKEADKQGKRDFQPKEMYMQQILELFGVNIEDDDTNIHGKLVCRTDIKMLKRFVEAQKAGRAFTSKAILFSFQPHVPNCNICQAFLNRVDEAVTCFVNLDASDRLNFVKCLPPKDLEKLAFDIGKLTAQDMAAEKPSEVDLDSLRNFNTSKWLHSRNRVLVSFIGGIDALRSYPDNEVKKIKATENLYALVFPNFLSPMSFMQNLLCYIASGSRKILSILSSANQGGSYFAHRRWLFHLPQGEITCPKGDTITMFDNEQVIQRKVGIKPANKAKSSIITNIAHIVLESSDLQKKEDLAPKVRFTAQAYDEELQSLEGADAAKLRSEKEKFTQIAKSVRDQNLDLYKELEVLHYQQVALFLQRAMDDVAKETSYEGGLLTDLVDHALEMQKEHDEILVCGICGISNPKTKRKCVHCDQTEGLTRARQDRKKAHEPADKRKLLKVTLPAEPQQSTTSQKFDHVPSNHPKEPAKQKVIVGEPVMCNPNSTENIALILRHIGRLNGIKRYGLKGREWTFISMDGLPFGICQKLREECVVCLVGACGVSFNSKAELHKHHLAEHNKEKLLFTREFDWFYLKVGDGHYEHTLLKAFFGFLWEPFFEVLAELMGFTSENAKQFARKCKDHHVSWQLFVVFHLAMLRELLVPYVRECIKNKTSPTVFDYLQNFCKAATNPNYKFAVEMVTRFGQAIFNFRMGIRRNNSKLAMAGKHMSKELFYARNHPKYQKIEIEEWIEVLSFPPEVRSMFEKNYSMSTSDASSGEGYDYKLEEENKNLLKCIPRGGAEVTEAHWLRASRNCEPLKEVYDKGSEIFKLRKDSEVKELKIDGAIKCWRIQLRKVDYLGKPNCSTASHKSVNGKLLHGDLHKMFEIASRKRAYKVCHDYLNSTEIEEDSSMRHPVFVTNDEEKTFTDTTKKTKQQLQIEIVCMLEKIEEPELQQVMIDDYNKNVRTKTKDKHIAMYNMLVDMLAGLQDVENMEKFDALDVSDN